MVDTFSFIQHSSFEVSNQHSYFSHNDVVGKGRKMISKWCYLKGRKKNKEFCATLTKCQEVIPSFRIKPLALLCQAPPYMLHNISFVSSFLLNNFTEKIFDMLCRHEESLLD